MAINKRVFGMFFLRLEGYLMKREELILPHLTLSTATVLLAIFSID
jgi:hypothetical protein